MYLHNPNSAAYRHHVAHLPPIHIKAIPSTPRNRSTSRTSISEQANLNLEKAFGGNVLTIGGVTELGRHAPKMLNLQAISNPFQNGVLPLSNEFPWLAKTGSVSEYGVYGANAYEGLQASFVRRFSKGLTASINYTWARGMSFTGGSCQPTQTAAAVVQTPGGAVNVPATDQSLLLRQPEITHNHDHCSVFQ